MTSLQKLKRQILQTLFFTTLIVLFVVCLLIAILTSQGNAINPDGDIVSTGVVRLFVTPQVRYTATINGEEVSVNSNRIEWIKPGVISLSLQADGYKDWKKEIVVGEGVILDIYVQFIPENLNIEQLTATSISNAVFSSDGSLIYFYVSGQDNDLENGLWRLRLARSILNLVQNEPQRMLAESAFPENFNAADWQMKLSSDNSQLLFISLADKQILNFDINNQRLNTLFPSINLSSMPLETFFFNGGRSLVFVTESGIYEHNFNTTRFNLVSEKSNRISFAVGYDEIYLMDRNISKIFIYENEQISEFRDIHRDQIFQDNIDQLSIKNIYLASGSERDNILVQDSSDRLFFIDINNKDIISLDIFNPLKISSSGRLVIGETKTGEIISALIESRQGGRRNTLIQNSIDFSHISSDIFISQNEKVLSYFREQSSGIFSLMRQDFDGTNKVSLMELNSEFLRQISFSPDNTEIFLIMSSFDTNHEEQILPNLNLHKIVLIED